MQRIPQRFVVGVLVILAIIAFVITGALAARDALPILLSVAGAYGVGHEFAHHRHQN